METLLEIRNLNKSIGSLKLLDINITLEPGYIMGLIGKNGSGKTSLIKTIRIFIKRTAGRFWFTTIRWILKKKKQRMRLALSWMSHHSRII